MSAIPFGAAAAVAVTIGIALAQSHYAAAGIHHPAAPAIMNCARPDSSAAHCKRTKTLTAGIDRDSAAR